MRFNIIQLIAIALIFHSCNKAENKSGLVYSNDIETAFAFTENPKENIVYFKNAHSGNYVCIIDSVNLYTIGYNMKVKDISRDPLKKVTIGAWFNAQMPGSDTKLVLDVRDANGNTISYIGHPVHESLTSTGDWTWIEMVVDLTKNSLNKHENTFRIYAFNTTGASVLVDDIKISYE